MGTLRRYDDKKHDFLYVIVLKCFKTLTFRDIF